MTKDINPGAAPIEESRLDDVASGGSSGMSAGKVSYSDLNVAGDPSQWGLAANQQAYKRGSFDITE